jgi:hypothetical protein
MDENRTSAPASSRSCSRPQTAFTGSPVQGRPRPRDGYHRQRLRTTTSFDLAGLFAWEAGIKAPVQAIG